MYIPSFDEKIPVFNVTSTRQIEEEKALKIINALTINPPISIQMDNFNPSLLPMEPTRMHSTSHAFYCLETAIKIGNFNAVKDLFFCYESTLPKWKKLMRDSLHMQVTYRPIFWLAGVSSLESAADMFPSLSKVQIIESCFDIICFMEEKLEISTDHRHCGTTPEGSYFSYSRSAYINKFCTDTFKRTTLLELLEKRGT